MDFGEVEQLSVDPLPQTANPNLHWWQVLVEDFFVDLHGVLFPTKGDLKTWPGASLGEGKKQVVVRGERHLVRLVSREHEKESHIPPISTDN